MIAWYAWWETLCVDCAVFWVRECSRRSARPSNPSARNES